MVRVNSSLISNSYFFWMLWSDWTCCWHNTLCVVRSRMLEKVHSATGGVAALPFLLAEAAATPRSIATALVFQQLDCYESNPGTSGCRPKRNNCVSGFAELDGLYISCQPQRLSCFFLPIMWHSQVNRLSGCSTLRFQWPIGDPTLTACFLDIHTFIVSTPDLKDTYIAVWSNSLLFVALQFCNKNNNKLQAKSRDQPDAAIHLLADQDVCLSYFAQKTTVNAFLVMFNANTTFKWLTNGKRGTLCCTSL